MNYNVDDYKKNSFSLSVFFLCYCLFFFPSFFFSLTFSPSLFCFFFYSHLQLLTFRLLVRTFGRWVGGSSSRSFVRSFLFVRSFVRFRSFVLAILLSFFLPSCLFFFILIQNNCRYTTIASTNPALKMKLYISMYISMSISMQSVYHIYGTSQVKSNANVQINQVYIHAIYFNKRNHKYICF